MDTRPMSATREEHDALGTLTLSDALDFGIQTARARENFPVSRTTIADIPGFVRSIAQIKKAAAIANRQIGVLPVEMAQAIVAAADEIIAHQKAEAFPVDIYHGGGGTSANMNLNEVIGIRANEILTGKKGSDTVHPNTHVNMGQSTNDVIPAAMKMTAYGLLASLEHALTEFVALLAGKEQEFAAVVKLGRTCLQDALPLTLGQQFSGYREGLQRQLGELARVRETCLLLPLAATAVGTEFGTFPGYKSAVYSALGSITGVTYAPEPNFFDGLQNADIWLSVSGALKAVGLLLNKFCADLRLMSSGPRAGLAEITLPAVQPGSSIMPGKINPVMPEMVMQIYFRVLGNDVAVTRACEGELDLNVWESLILNCISESATLLTAALPLLGEKCVRGIRADVQRCARDAEHSLALSTVLATLFDYERASAVAQRAAAEGKTIEAVVVESGIMSAADARRYLDPAVLTSPEKFRALFDAKMG
ncbi:Aspartate ammonia-lyase [Paraburkholderia aspalathi]|uniref:aspartate ammonia-lyase n=1 Tax=Paraburkholderia aspalathi TaxID=1324617 RepID=UPI00190B0F89|nr:aspartate ammonia-lyase [Paraburkholderia aspalathi]CAE6866630.1 Aspartate ammonia-lyase [Paraburkholderia aspalathi]